MTMTFASAKNAKIICECTKMHNYVICKSKEAGSEYGTVGVFYGDVLILNAMELYHCKEMVRMTIVILVY
jgi:hypothetical protein